MQGSITSIWKESKMNLTSKGSCPEEAVRLGIRTLESRDFPGSPVVKNLPCNAGDAGLIPDQGTKIPQHMGQLSHHATTIGPTMKVPHAATKTQHSQK